MKTLFGKELKAPKWNVIEESVEQISAEMLPEIKHIVAHHSDQYNNWYCTITLKDGSYVSFTLDVRCEKSMAEGLLCNPKTFMVYNMTNGEKTIRRCYAEAAEE